MTSDIWIATDAAGFILDCSAPALTVLGYSARGARGRELPNLFISGRPRLSELLRVAQGETLEREATFRPHERKALPVRFSVRRQSASDDRNIVLVWTFDVRWSLNSRMPRGVDRRQLITVWRLESLRCIFVPAGQHKRRLFVCTGNDEVIHEESPPTSAAAFARAAELRQLAGLGQLAQPDHNNVPRSTARPMLK
jgi:PAS domain-containing protein